jgi:hypothetical protein
VSVKLSPITQQPNVSLQERTLPKSIQWLLWLSAAAAATLLALCITYPKLAVALLGVTAVVLVIRAIHRRPLFALELSFCLFPVYPLFRAFVVAFHLPVPTQGLRFWSELVLLPAIYGLLVHQCCRRSTSRFSFSLTTGDIPALIFLTAGLYGLTLTALTKHPFFVIFGSHFMLLPLLYYLVARWMRPTETDCRRLVKLFVIGYVALALASFVDFFYRTTLSGTLSNAMRPEIPDSAGVDGVVFWMHYMRMQSLLFEENVWGSLCGFISMFSMARIATDKAVFKRQWPLWALSTLCLGFSVSRGAVAGWIVGTLVLLLIRTPFRRRLIAIFSIVAVVAATSAFLLKDDPRVRVWYVLMERSGISEGKVANDRWPQWVAGYQIFTQSPSGTGVGTVGYGASKTGMALSVVADGMYITTLAEIGVPGVLLTIALGVSAFVVILKPLRNGTPLSPFMRALGLTLIVQLCATYVHAVSANTFEYYYTYPVFWMLFGVYVTVTEQAAIRRRETFFAEDFPLAIPAKGAPAS